MEDSIVNFKNKAGITRRDVLWAFAISVLFVIWNLKNSFEFGRLAVVPSYDDISYFQDAITRYLKFRSGNAFVLFRDLISNPPHAPLLTLQAVLSYIIFGPLDWAPYVTNIWIPFAVFILIIQQTRNSPLTRSVLLIYVATLPMLSAAIVEFRPDIVAGLITAIACVLLVFFITDSDLQKNRNITVLTGVVSGVAFLAKPSAVVYTFGIFGIAVVFSSALTIFLSGVDRRKMTLGVVYVLAIALAVAGPYFIFSGKQVAQYIWNAVVRDKSIWAVDMSWSEHATFYLNGTGGQFMLGAHLWLVGVAVVLLVYYRSLIPLRQQQRYYILLCTAFVGYVVVSINPVKTHFLGVAFQSILFVFSMLVFMEVLRSVKIKEQAILALPLIFGSLLSIQPVAYFGSMTDVRAKDIKDGVDEICNIIASETLNNPSPINVFITFTGHLNQDLIKYELLKHGITSAKIHGWFYRPNEEDPRIIIGRAADYADLVVAASDGTYLGESSMPSNRILPFTLGLIRDDHRFETLKVVPSGAGEIYVFKKKSNKPTE